MNRRAVDPSIIVPGRPVDWQMGGQNATDRRTYKALLDMNVNKVEGSSDLPNAVPGELLVFTADGWAPQDKRDYLALDDLTDVVLTAPTLGDTLQHNGSLWVNAPLSGLIALDDLSDVIITAPATAQTLRYNGSTWVNAALSADDLSNESTLVRTTMPDGRNIAFGTTTGSKIGTGTTQKLAFYNATPIAQQANTVDLSDVLTNLGFRASGGNPPLNLNSGTLTAGLAALSSGVRGNGGAVSFGTATITFPSDADYTISAAEMANGYLIIANGVITAPRNLIVPATTGGRYVVQNLNTQTVTVKTAAGTGVAMATNDILHARVGANVVSMKPTV